MPRAMFRLTRSIDLAAPLEEVFWYLSDFSRHSEWDADRNITDPMELGKFRCNSCGVQVGATQESCHKCGVAWGHAGPPPMLPTIGYECVRHRNLSLFRFMNEATKSIRLTEIIKNRRLAFTVRTEIHRSGQAPDTEKNHLKSFEFESLADGTRLTYHSQTLVGIWQIPSAVFLYPVLTFGASSQIRVWLAEASSNG